MPGTRSGRDSTPVWCCSLHFSPRPDPAQARTVGRRGRVDFRQAAPVFVNVLASMPSWNAARRQRLEGLPKRTHVILDQRVRKAGFVTLFAPHQAPDQVLVASVELVDASLLLDCLRAVQFKPRLREDHQIAAQPRRDRHAAKTTDHAVDDADDRHLAAQRNDFGMDLSDDGLAEISLLQANTASFQQKHWQDRLATLAVAPRQPEGASDFAGGNFSHATPLECSLDRHDHGRPATELPSRDDNTVIRLRNNSFKREPRGFHSIERAEQLAEAARIKNRLSALARPHLDDALALQEAIPALFGDRIVVVCGVHHDRASSAACSRRKVTVPGVAPKSLISTLAARPNRAKKRSSTSFQTWV